jgi:general secretion pathway protein D
MPSRLTHVFPFSYSLSIGHNWTSSKMFGRLFTWLFLCVTLAGCAAQMAYRDGKELVAQDKVEAGLTKFQEAIGRDPRNVEYKEAYLQTRERAGYSWLEQADRLAAAGKRTDAEKLYRRVLTIDPGSERARDGLMSLDMDLRHIQMLKDAESALNNKEFDTARLKLATVRNENPSNEKARNLQRTLLEKTARPPAETVLSAAYKKPITIEFKDVALKQIFEVIARTSGLNFLFDKDVKIDQKTSIFLKNSTIETAVHFTLLTNQLEQQVLDANTILIYPNTAAKLKDYQEMVIKSFFLTNADAKLVANSLKSMLKVRDVVIDEKLNMLIMRDSKEAVQLAEKIIALQDVAEPEVMLEVEILEVKRTRLLELGIQWPNSLTLTPLSVTGTGGTSSALTLYDLQNQTPSTIGAGISPLTFRARQEDSDANLLANPRIRTRNHEKAKILIGDRVPNITTTATATGFVSEAVNYIDVGLKLDVEPTIYLNNDVAIKISMEVSNIVSQIKTQSGSVAYQIGTRTASTVLRLKDGENQVLAGLINDEDRSTGNKIPGLGDLPILGRLFGSNANNNQKTEIVLSITPHLIRNIQRPELAQSEFRAGTESSMRTRPDSSGGTPVVNVPASGSHTSDTPIPAQHTPPPTPNNPGNIASSGTGAGYGGGTGIGANPNTPAGVVLSWQGPTQLKVGDIFTSQLMMQSNQPVTSVPLAIGFDTQAFQVVGVTEGEFLKQGGAQTSFTSRIDPSGQVQITASRPADSGATTLGSVAILSFRALTAVNASNIQLLTIAPVGIAGVTISASLPPPQTIQVLP